MSFKNARYQNVTAKRAVNTDYVNDTGKLIAIAITIHNSDDHGQCQYQASTIRYNLACV